MGPLCSTCARRRRVAWLFRRKSIAAMAALVGAGILAPQWIAGRSAVETALAADVDALRERVDAVCPDAERAPAPPSERCLLLRSQLDRKLAVRHRALAEAALSSRDYVEADRQFRLALTYAGFDVAVADEIRRSNPALPGTALDDRRLYEARLGSVVQIRMKDRLGSGVVVAPHLVLTNAHVIGDEDHGLVVTAADEEVSFDWILKHPIADIAMLRVPELHAEPAPLGSGLTLRPGDRISLIGSPQGLAFSFSNGAVSAVGRRLDDDPAAMIQFTAPISQGSSGAPLFDADGRVSALASLFFNEGQALNFAVPIEYGIELMEMASAL